MHEVLLIRELTPSLIRTQFEQNFLRDSAYFIYANHQPKKCHFVSNHFEMTLERGSYPRYLWAQQLVTSSNVCKCIEPLGPRANPGQLTGV